MAVTDGAAVCRSGFLEMHQLILLGRVVKGRDRSVHVNNLGRGSFGPVSGVSGRANRKRFCTASDSREYVEISYLLVVRGLGQYLGMSYSQYSSVESLSRLSGYEVVAIVIMIEYDVQPARREGPKTRQDRQKGLSVTLKRFRVFGEQVICS
ncbi:uncharacterized protein C8Q71DRAFT_727211 [Rhodofomes roseus]|uniref:Uncharacterized protein n=1 Tax=Rhodofomes roseus TaxID=34475 RepID=A0ABQ8K1U6_9APHY|nr:uncharacterized protein C8Q71DRAFT_727211 [Rhodofomes roseus]KAH9830720.1 hypothetical protein C8Q71DRAFT_727211 [Rhodofomes roseus]